MKINADLTERAVVYTEELPWVESQQPGVERRMIERDGGEVARATTLVRYAASTSYQPHLHEGGEEFLVLEGIFSDEMGDYPSGTYVRNPPGSTHAPRTKDGCTIFVKLRQFDPDDQRSVRVNTETAQWAPGPFPGLTVLPLHSFGSERVALAAFEPGARPPEGTYAGGFEVFVLDGVLEETTRRYPKGTWLRVPSGGALQVFSKEGCTLWTKAGHLSPAVGREDTSTPTENF